MKSHGKAVDAELPVCLYGLHKHCGCWAFTPDALPQCFHER